MALDGAVHDWIGKAAGRPTWELFRMPRTLGPTVYTISMASPDEAVSAVRKAPDVGALKVKVGGPDELEALEAIRTVTALPVRIDANEAWDLDTARALTPRLRQLGIQLIEQPFPTTAVDDYHRYREFPDRLPVFLDEGCTDVASVLAARSYADGIVVKLCKAGGIRGPGRGHGGRPGSAGLRTTLSCSVRVRDSPSAEAARLAPLADHIDMDWPSLTSATPVPGLGLTTAVSSWATNPAWASARHADRRTGSGTSPAPGTTCRRDARCVARRRGTMDWYEDLNLWSGFSAVLFSPERERRPPRW